MTDFFAPPGLAERSFAVPYSIAFASANDDSDSTKLSPQVGFRLPKERG
jgi:hypothetical protein